MKKPKNKTKQLAAQRRAAKRNKRDIRIRKEKAERRLKYERARELTLHGMKKFEKQLEEAHKKFQESNGIS